MSVRREKRKDPETGAVREFFMVDINFTFPDGKTTRVRKVAPIQTKRAAEAYEREVRQALLSGTYGKETEVVQEASNQPQAMPKVEEFVTEFLETYAVVNNKASEQANKRSICRLYVVPHLGKLPLDLVSRELEPFKAMLKKKELSEKRINNILAVVSKMLRYAEERGVLGRAPRVRLLKLPPSKFDFFDVPEYGRLIEAAEKDEEWSPAILVAGEAGLRMGEIMALEWSDIDFGTGNLTVRRAEWQGIVSAPKGWRARTVPMTDRLSAALKAHRHLRGARVFLGMDGSPLTRNKMKKPLWRACRRAGLREVGWHVLRHTFCSHLAMQGAVPKAIQELAGHTSLAVTMQYMHLAPAMLRDTVRLLDQRGYGNLTANKNGR